MGFYEAIARDICDDDLPYDKALAFCRLLFENWTDYEKNHRPVDISEVYDCAIDYYQLNGDRR